MSTRSAEVYSFDELVAIAKGTPAAYQLKLRGTGVYPLLIGPQCMSLAGH